jgi:hypothetical protein
VSKLARTLVLGAMLAAINLAGMTAVAQAQANDEGKDARRPPTERQVGESWRQPQVASQEQTAADAALRRQLARERFSIPSGTPAQAPAPTQADESSGQPAWLGSRRGEWCSKPVSRGRSSATAGLMIVGLFPQSDEGDTRWPRGPG